VAAIDPVALTRSLVDIDSTTGREGEAGQFLARYLRELGYAVDEQPVSDGRFNVYARLDASPRVVFSTHFDCVPPFFPSRIEGGVLHGRGACDAKGILACQVAAAERLRAEGETRFGLVFVAGEERGSDGAKAANTIASQTRYLINGEPTELKLGLATRGCFRVRLTAHGKAAHSGYPELGESAIEKLIDVLNGLRGASWPADPLLGDPLAASYDDVDPYKEVAVTNAAPSAVSEGTSGPTFHGWSTQTGHADFTDTWASGQPVTGTGSFEVRCPTVGGPPTGNPPAAGPGGSAPQGGAHPGNGSNPPSQPGGPGQSKKNKHGKPRGEHEPPRLTLTLIASTGRARPSSVIGYRIIVSNPGGSAARAVEVCDQLPAGQRLLRTMPAAVGESAPCWKVGTLAAGAQQVLRLTAMVEPGSGSGVQRHAATASAASRSAPSDAAVAVRIRPLPESGCGSRLARPLTASTRFRC